MASALSNLGRDLAAALKAGDCGRARVQAARMQLAARTANERMAVQKAVRKVASCRVAALGRARGKRRRITDAERAAYVRGDTSLQVLRRANPGQRLKDFVRENRALIDREINPPVRRPATRWNPED